MAELVPGQLDTSITYYQKIVKVTPTSGRAYEAQLALRRLANTHPTKNIKIPEINLYEMGGGS